MNQRSRPIKLRFRDSYITTPQLPVSKDEMIRVLNPLKGHELVLFVEREGSMDPFKSFIDTLIETFQEMGCVSSGIIYEFDVAPTRYLFIKMGPNGPIDTSWGLKGLDDIKDIKDIVIISDAGAARKNYYSERLLDTILFLNSIREAHICYWLNPVPEFQWKGSTAEDIAKHVNMISLDVEGLERFVSNISVSS